MPYDFDLIRELSRELGFACAQPSPNELAIALDAQATLAIVNADSEGDSLIGFESAGGWHYHGDLQCSDPRGNYIDLDYVGVLTGLADGTVLICEGWEAGALRERWLVHCDYMDGLRYLPVSEEIRIRRARPTMGIPTGRRQPS